MRSRGLSHQPVPYVHRLQQATAQAPLPSHKDVYGEIVISLFIRDVKEYDRGQN